MSTELNHIALRTWEAIATNWDESVGLEGNKYWKFLQQPYLEKLIDVTPETKALDLATGNGLVARWLAGRGARVIATDGSENMLERAIARTTPEWAERITFQKLDVTDPAAFDALIANSSADHVGDDSDDGKFDVVVINMAIMDIPTLEPLAQALVRLLKKDGVFVASMLHPVFFTSGATRAVEVTNEHKTTDRPIYVRTHTIKDYLEVPPWRGVAQYGQPEFQLYFHRPLHELFGVFFKAGLRMDALEEPSFREEHMIVNRAEARSNFTQIPPIMFFRMRRA